MTVGTDCRLLADVGGTHARFALQRPGKAPSRYRVLKTDQFASLELALAEYLDLLNAPQPATAALAVAAPITGDTVTFTNASWSFSQARLKRQTGIAQLHVLNDFEVLSWALPALTGRDLRKVGRGRPKAGAVRVVFGAGTGLGVSCLVPSAAGRPLALATEGGHSTLAAGNAREEDVIAVLREQFGHVSAERVLSGPGLTNLYEALAVCDGVVARTRMKPSVIVRTAQAGRDRRAVETVRIFSGLMGQFGGDLALQLGVRGGVFVAGGVVGRLGTAFDTKEFRRRFEAKGRYRDWLAAVPTYLITHPRPAFLGLANYLEIAAGH